MDSEPCNYKQQPILDKDFNRKSDLRQVSNSKGKYLLNNYFSFIRDPNLLREKWLILNIGD